MFCLIALARISSTMLKRSGEREHPYLLPDFNEKASFSPLSMMLAVGWLEIGHLYQAEVVPL